MSELQRLDEAYHRFEEATETLRDLLDAKARDRLMLAIKAARERGYTAASLWGMEATLGLLDWLFNQGEGHLDGILADANRIDLAQANREREGKAWEMARRIGVPPRGLPRLKAVLEQAKADIAQAKAKATKAPADQAERCGHA